jgi:outer membrane protein TolC
MWGLLALVLAVNAGCKQRAFLTETDQNDTTTTLLDHMQSKADLVAKPLIQPVNAPPTLDDLDRKVRFISLAECIALSLEQGRVGQPSLLFPGTALDNLVQFTGAGVTGSDAIRVLALDPARTGVNIEASLSKFDAALSTSMIWTGTDTPIGTSLQTFQAGTTGINATVQQDAVFNATLIKPLASGGIASLTMNVPYTFTNLPARVNPSYRPSLQFGFEQPLLQGFGVEINQLRNAHPGSVLNPGILNTATSSEGILITRLRFDQARGEFERQVNQMLLNVEVAYWNLYGGYWTVYSREQGLRFAYESFRQAKTKFEAGSLSPVDFYQARGQYEQFRAQRLAALDALLEFERNLRSLTGLAIEDGTRIMPSDSPTLAPFKPDWSMALNDAIEKRPELFMARQDVKAAQLRLILAKNSLLPDVRFTATYDTNSLGGRLDGAGTGSDANANALSGLTQGNFHNYSAGIRATIPIGYRLAYTQVRSGQLDLARSLQVLQDQEGKAQNFLHLYYRRLSLNYKQIQSTRAQREAFGELVKARSSQYAAGYKDITLQQALDAQRSWADALSSEFQAIVLYNNAIAGFEYGKGTIQQHNNVHIAEGALPNTAFVRAVDHQKQRTAALVLRERANPAEILPMAGTVGADPMTPSGAPSLPSTMAARPLMRDAPELPTTVEQMKKTTAAPVERSPEELFPTSISTPSTPPIAPQRMPLGGQTSTRRVTEFGAEKSPN